ncbi:ESCRT-I component [Colletotrichum higginsianum]|uniref:ESCRT-I component n=1 Tax=Colletotrichum higginsianum (strain IMI 349063) TaxID=759273 RepID=H1VZT0_COLHI|nr:ESCRT-I component [Colletotrichum higginsianum]
MPVPQHVLNWLYSVLTSEYHDVNRTYNDVAQALSHYSSLSPRTDVHTFDNGASALLLHLSGTLPVIFRGTTYRFPISIWVPHAYPREAPLVYVTPTETMMVRPGQHVDPQGQIYHPYLVGWAAFWDKSTILDFLAILRDIFAKEPPVLHALHLPRQNNPALSLRTGARRPRSKRDTAPLYRLYHLVPNVQQFMETTVYIRQIGLRVRLTPVTTRLPLCLRYLPRNNYHHQPCPHVPRTIFSSISGTNFLTTTLLIHKVPPKTLGTPPCSYLIGKVLLNTMDLRPGGSRPGSIRHSCCSKNGAYSTSHLCNRI